MELLNPDNAYSGANLVVILALIMLSSVFFICFSGFVKYSIVLNVIKNAIGTQQIPPTIVVNLLASLMALNSLWPDIKPGIDSIKPYFSASAQLLGEQQIDILSHPDDVNMYYLVTHWSDYFPEVLKKAEQKTSELTQLVKIPLNFDADDNLFNCLIGSLILDLYRGFELGLKLYMIFVSIDFLVAVVLSGVGMTMLSPTVISTPIKLAIFYFSDSWTVLFNAVG